MLAFAHPERPCFDRSRPGEAESDDDDESDDDEGETGKVKGRERWLISGGKDGRVAVWSLMDFEKGKK